MKNKEQMNNEMERLIKKRKEDFLVPCKQYYGPPNVGKLSRLMKTDTDSWFKGKDEI